MSKAKVIIPIVISDSMLTSSTVAETDYTAFDAATNYALGDRVLYAATHHNYELAASPAKTVTISIASPAVVASSGHALVADTPVVFSTTGALPTGLTAGTTYYVKNPTADAYQLSATVGGAAINTSGTQSGVHTATARPLPTNDSYWLDLGSTNKWAMFDNVVGSSTSGASPLTVVLAPGSISGIGMLELVGRNAQIEMKDGPGGTTVYDRTVDLDGTIIESIFDWFFTEYEQRTDFALTDLPAQFANCELTVSVTATSGSPSVGVCKPGNVVEIGDTQYGAKVGIIDYGKKDTDQFGQTTFIQRSYSKRATFDLVTDKSSFNKIFRRLASIRSTPAIYIGTELDGFEPLMVYGVFKDFSIDVAYPSHHLCSLEIEGLV